MFFLSVHKLKQEADKMEENGHVDITWRQRTGVWISRIFLAAALAISILTIRNCCPHAVQAAMQWLGLGENGKTREAFSTLRDALADGESAVAAFAESYQVIVGETP